MKKKIFTGFLLGLIAGVIDLIPMVIQNLTWDANLGALSMWIVVGFIVATTELPVKGVVKGILYSFLVLLPSAFIIGWKAPLSLIPISAMTLLLGGGLGYFYHRMIK